MNAVFSMFGSSFLALVTIVNPVGAVAGVAGLSADFSPAQRRQQVLRTAICVFGILVSFTILGNLVLDTFGLDIPAIQIGGGFVVALSGLVMLTPKDPLSPKEREQAGTKRDISVTPMALPLIAGPGAIAEVLALTARFPGPLDRLDVLCAVVVIALMIFALLRWGTPVVEKLGPTGVGALIRIIGFIILCIGVELMIHGVKVVLT